MNGHINMISIKKKGKKSVLLAKALITYNFLNSKHNIDSSELEAFEKYVSERLECTTKKELKNTEETINDYIESFIRNYCV